MSKYAYRDIERKHKIYAEQANSADNHASFYCPNNECDAILYLKSNSSTTGKRPHFAAKPSYPHIDNCFCCKDNFSFEVREFDETLFNFETITKEYLTNDFQNTPKRLDTMSAIFYMCKTQHLTNTYNDTKIWKILVDNRSNPIYSKGIYGSHIIECSYSRYDKESLTIFLDYPIDRSLPNKYRIAISFTDEILFKKIRNKLYNPDKNLIFPILIIGKWEHQGESTFGTKISNSYQIYFTK